MFWLRLNNLLQTVLIKSNQLTADCSGDHAGSRHEADPVAADGDGLLGLSGVLCRAGNHDAVEAQRAHAVGPVGAADGRLVILFFVAFYSF